MRLEILPIDLIGPQGQPLLEPADRKLHDMAVDYKARELEGGESLDLSRFSKCWVAVEMEGHEYREIAGLAGFVYRIDIPVFRVSGQNSIRATKMLTDRIRNFFQDQGLRGQELFLHISSKERPEQRCQNWKQSLQAVGAVPADRFSVKI